MKPELSLLNRLKEMFKSQLRLVLTCAILVFAFTKVNSQTTMPEELSKSTLKEQLNYLDVHTRIYENYRAIREDMFQKVKGNVSDTLLALQTKIVALNNITTALNHTIDSLNTTLETTKNNLEEMTRTKNSIKVMGVEFNKTTYNILMWIIVAGLAGILVIGFLAFQRNLIVTSNAKKELYDLKDEFETYRKTTREAREKATRDHFNEIKKLKGG